MCNKHVILFFTMFFLLSGSAMAATSKLWGQKGEKWKPQNRLPDYAYAGYHTTGFRDIPTPPVKITINDDGDKDITAELKAAVGSAQGKRYVILIPEGTWKLSNVITIKKSGIVSRTPI